MSASITPKELALMCDTDDKTMRRFMRSLTTERVGRGGRWEIASEDVDVIVSAFKSRSTSRTATFDASKIKGEASK